MSKYLARHIANIQTKVPCQPLELLPGHLCYIQYKNKLGTTKYSMYIILDVNPKLSRTIHALDMGKIDIENLYRLMDFVIDGRPFPTNFKQKSITRFLWKVGPIQNYRNFIKNRLQNDIPGSYKVLKMSNIKRIQVIDYKWQETLIERYVRD